MTTTTTPIFDAVTLRDGPLSGTRIRIKRGCHFSAPVGEPVGRKKSRLYAVYVGDSENGTLVFDRLTGGQRRG